MSVNSKMTAIADEIRDKTGNTELLSLDQMAESISKVYEAGKASMIDESKLLPITISGNCICADNVSEIPHTVECKISGVDNPENIKVIRAGKNLFDINRFAKELQSTDNSIYPTHFGTDGEYEYIAVSAAGHTNLKYMDGEFEKNTQYTLSFSGKTDGVYLAGINVKYTDGSDKLIRLNTSWGYYTYITDADKTVNGIQLYTYANNYGLYSNIMLNRGTTALPYEDANCQVLTPNADGTVEGMTSVSPYMNVFSDTEGVNLEVTYNKSWGMQEERERFYNDFKQGKINVSISFEWLALDKANTTSIINALSDTATGQTLTLNLNSVNTSFETSSGAADGNTSEEFLSLVASKPNWTISLI